MTAVEPAPFFEKAIATAVYKVDMPSLEVFKAVLLSLAGLTESMMINSNHDTIEKAFRRGMKTLSASGVQSISRDLEPLFRHIAAEKERCALEIAKHLQERDGKKEGKRRTVVNVSEFGKK